MQAKLSGAKRLCEMGEMMAALAHQIRTPLASALLHATNLQSYPDQHQRLMPKLVERLRNLERLLDGMLCFAREGALEVVEIPIADLLNDFSSCLKGEPSDGIAAMEMDAVALSARIVGNAPALRSVFQNLVNNARQAGGPDVTLRARTRLDGEGLEILLSDDGPGIAPELRERVFEPFVTTQPDGVGLGLAIARRIIESHRGTLTLGQEARAGATFIIRLPRLLYQQHFWFWLGERQPMSVNVLVVEDDLSLRQALCDTLELAGFAVATADNGTAALDVIGAGGPALVISDVQMNGMNGLELLHQVKTRQPELPMLLMTAFGTIEQAVSAMQDGAADYLVKPFEAQVLLNKVSELVDRNRVDDQALVAVDVASRELLSLARRVAVSDVTVVVSRRLCE